MYIVSTALIGMICASVCAAMLIFGSDEIMLGLSVIIGIVFSVLAMIAQFRMNRGRALEL